MSTLLSLACSINTINTNYLANPLEKLEEFPPPVLCATLLRILTLKDPLFLGLLNKRHGISKNDRLNLCIKKQEKIKKIKEEGKKSGYEIESNRRVFLSPEEEKYINGYHKRHSARTIRKERSVNEVTYIPPFFSDVTMDRKLLRNKR